MPDILSFILFIIIMGDVTIIIKAAIVQERHEAIFMISGTEPVVLPQVLG